MKLLPVGRNLYKEYPAAFGRLCVETGGQNVPDSEVENQPPSGGCVLKQHEEYRAIFPKVEPAAFGRLCVETEQRRRLRYKKFASRLRAAVC